MSIGIPGTGVGAAFYLLTAIGAPLRELFQAKGSRRWRAAFKLFAIAAVITATVAATAWAVGLIVPTQHISVLGMTTGETGNGSNGSHSILSDPLVVAIIFGPFAILFLLALTVQVIRLATLRSWRERENIPPDLIAMPTEALRESEA